ncbi:redox protein SirA [Clostridium sp. chh4-2]|uniref:sulfurtransferase TusA family protein n=1 Tax=Clostridium sp. chh4-2 TaxID=2067550 RepID=UPI000CCE4923|nr:sulfurtransferase TusA family protein [Clostridium sp. chh4-2]PNV63531.1 redox protein SirA [Clostridium sp. chh4-2]
MIEVDARGLSCPEPLMLTDQAMKKHPGESIKVVVTEAHSKTNVEKFAKSKGRSVTVKEVGHEYELMIE